MSAYGTDSILALYLFSKYLHTPNYLSLTENVLDDDLILLVKQSERVPAGLAGWYWIRLHPSTAGEPVEVVTRVNSVVHGVQNGAGGRHTSLRCTQSLYKQT